MCMNNIVKYRARKPFFKNVFSKKSFPQNLPELFLNVGSLKGNLKISFTDTTKFPCNTYTYTPGLHTYINVSYVMEFLA